MEVENVNVKNWKSLIKPSKLDVQISDDLTHAKIVAEPLEKGYGLTLGNSLRRILLSSIRGAAVTSIQIDGVLHEFTSIKGVREDVTDIVLNVKELEKKLSHIKKPITLSIIGCVVNGPGEASQTEIGLTGGGQDNNLLYLSGIPHTKVASSKIINKVVQLVEEKVKEKNN